MGVANSMFRGFYGSMKTRGDEVIEKANTGALKDTVEKTEPNAATINASNIDNSKPIAPPSKPLEVVDTTNLDVPKTADEILDTSAPVNPKRQSNLSFDGRNYNLSNITDPDELISVIDFIGSKTDNFVNARGGGPESFDQTLKNAKNSSVPELERIIGYKLGDGVTPSRVAGARILLQESADNLRNMALKVQAGEGDVNFQLKFRQAISSHVGIQQAVAGMAADSGRALNAWRIPVGADMGQGSSIYRTQLQTAVDKYGGEKAISKLADVILDSKDLTQVTARLEKAHFANSTDLVLEYWINSLLSSPATHVVNMSSNLLVSGLAVPERFLAATFGKIFRTDEGIEYGEAVAQMYGHAAGMRDGFRLAYKSLKTGETSDPAMKYEARKYNAFSAENIDHMGGALFDIKAGSSVAKGVDFFGDWVIRLPSKFLGAEDEFFKSVGYRMELNSLAYRTAKGEGLEGAEFGARVRELIENPTEEIHLGAVDASKYQTFTNDLGDSGKAAQKFINNFPPAKIILPFVRTPTNIIKYTAHRTPFNKQMWADVQAGGVKRDVALARMSMGSSALFMGYEMALSGKITGRGPANKEHRDALRLTGWQPYSYVDTEGKYYSFNRLDPVGMFLGLAADTAEVIQYGDDLDSMEYAMAAISAVASNVQNKSYMEGISNFVKAADDMERFGPAYVERLVASFTPATSLVGQIERTIDPTINEVNSIYDKIASRTPYLSADLPPRRNIFGKPIILQGGLGWDFVSPVYTSKSENDPVADEIVRQEAGVRMHRRFYGTGKFRTEYTPEEYDRLVVLTGQEIKDTKGPYKGLNLHDTLAAVINSPMYLDKRMTDGPDGSRAALITNVINKFKQAAIKKLLTDTSEPLHADFLARVIEKENLKGMAYDSSFTGIGQ
tara:strand:+ start:282 stop:2984 length:2703 start_codon:yes stop_codon:yes gene_type:complete